MKLRFLGAAICLAASACAFVEANSVQYVGVPRFAPGKPEEVQVLPSEPTRRHDRLGEVLLDISADPAPPVADIEARLREEGAKMGAHAVYVIRDIKRPGENRRLIGIAIRYH
jgi:hypothetical protein